MAELAGTNSIEYYLKGRAVKEQRDANIARQQMAQQQAELKAQQLENAWKVQEVKAKEVSRFHDAQIKKMENDYTLRIQEARSKLAKDIQMGNIEPDPDNQGEFRLTVKGTAAIEAAKAAALKEKALSPIRIAEKLDTEIATGPAKGQTAGYIAQGQVPARLVIQNDQQAFQEAENAKNRAANRENVLTRASAVLSNKSAAKEDKDAVIGQMVADYLPDVLAGAPEGSLEALPKGDMGLRLRNGIKAQGINILTRKQVENLEGMQRLQSFYEKAKELKELISKGVIGNFGEIKQRQDELAADLVIFGREAKAEKGVVTDRDIDRLRAALPQMIPGGVGGLFADKNKANDKRVNDILEAYHEKVESVLGPKMKPEQKKAIRERWKLMPKIPSHLERIN